MYRYEEHRKEVFTPEGVEMLFKITENVKGREVFTINEAIKGLSGDTWTMLACVDYLVETNKFDYVYVSGPKQQHVLRWVRHD